MNARGANGELLDRADRVDRLCWTFECAWRSGERPRMENYLHKAGDSDYEELFQELLLLEFELRTSAGEQPSAADYRMRFPNHDRLVAALLQTKTHPHWPEIPGYRVLAELGRGGMGIVYRAEEIALGRQIALKVLRYRVPLDDRPMRRFEREARAAAGLHHTNIVPVFGVGEYQGLPFT